MVTDIAAEKQRDVDITVIKRSEGRIECFKGIEVKAEARPLDVVHVEQLYAKLNDMPELTDRAIVSASGYSDSARRKAERHGVELLRLDEWDPDHQRLGTAIPKDMVFQNRSLNLNHANIIFDVDWEGRQPARVREVSRVTDASGTQIPGVPNIKALAQSARAQVGEDYRKQPTVEQVPDGNTIPVDYTLTFEQRFRVWAGGRSGLIRGARLTARAVWTTDALEPHFKILLRDSDASLFVGCVVTELPDGSLIGIAIQETLAPLTYFRVPVSDRNRTKIRGQKWPRDKDRRFTP